MACRCLPVTGSAPKDVVYGGDNPDTIYGGSGPDYLDGGLDEDVIEGQAGDDTLIGTSGSDLLRGGSDHDLLIGSATPDGKRGSQLFGGTGNDRLIGSELAGDVILGESGNDEISGLGGDDYIVAGIGNDIVFGDAGNDRIEGGDGDDTLSGNLGDDEIHGGRGADEIEGNDGDDRLFGEAGNDLLRGGTGRDVVDGGRGVDELYGGVGDDLVYASTGVGDVLHGDEGNDRLIGSDEGGEDPDFTDGIRFGDVIYGGPGDDSISGLGGADVIDGQAGRDTIDGGTHADSLSGGDGDDAISAGPSSGDRLFGNAGNDTLTGSYFGADHLEGGLGEDRLFGRGGDDTLLGQAGDDLLDGGAGTDHLEGGEGRDVLYGGGGDGDRLEGGAGADVLHGSDDGADLLFGQGGRDVLYAYAGNDRLEGGPDDDQLDGGAGDDTLLGGLGIDLLVGGLDHDSIYGHATDISDDDDGAVDYLYGDLGRPGEGSNGGNDQLFGQGGNDILFGEGGDDRIVVGDSTSDAVDYGSGESADPAAFVSASLTPAPTLRPQSPKSLRAHRLPEAVAVPGRWRELSGSATAGGLSNQAGWESAPAIAVTGQTLYATWTGKHSDASHVHLARWDGTRWSDLRGSADPLGIDRSDSTSENPSLAIGSSGQPLVGWIERQGSESNVLLSSWDEARQEWIGLGESLEAGGVSGTGAATAVQVAVGSTGPVVAWLDRSSGVSQLFVRRFDGGSWLEVVTGSATGSGTSQSAVDIREFDLAVSGERIAVSWIDESAASPRLLVREFNGQSWQPIEEAFTSIGVDAHPDDRYSPAIAFHQEQLFAAWTQIEDHERTVGVGRRAGDQWQRLAIADFDGKVFSPHASGSPSLASSADKLVLDWHRQLLPLAEDSTGKPIRAALDIAQWNGSQFVETFPGEATGRGAISSSETLADPVVVLSDSGQPIVAWTQQGKGQAEIFLRVGQPAAAGAVHRATAERSVADILATETLGPGDTIVIEGDQPGFTVGADDSGVLIVNRGFAKVLGDVQVNGASGVILQGLRIDGALSLASSNAITLRETVAGDVTLDGGADHVVVGNMLDSLSLSGGVSGVVARDNTVALSVAFTEGGASGVLLEHNRSASLKINAPSSGEIRSGELRSLEIGQPFDGRIHRNTIRGGDVGVVYAASVVLEANRIFGHRVGISATVADPEAALGFVAGTTLPNDIYQNEIGVELSGRMQRQTIRDNGVGVTGSGTLGGDSLETANHIDSNPTGIQFQGTVVNNRITRNGIGLVAVSDQTISRNVFARHQDVSILADNIDRTRIVHNTFDSQAADNVRAINGTSTLEIRSNLFSTESGTNLYFDDASQGGHVSDYNVLHAGDGGVLVHWSKDFTDLLDWQADLAEYDLHSRGTTRIHPGWAEPLFVSAANDDFNLLPPLANQRLGNLALLAADPIDDIAFTREDGNLLSNPGFESALAGWSVNDLAAAVADGDFAFDGAHYFAPGEAAVGRDRTKRRPTGGRLQ